MHSISMKGRNLKRIKNKNKSKKMAKAIVRTDFNFPGQTNVYHGKVRDVYSLANDILVMIVSDRISAFDVVLPEGIPFKGQVLNQIASKFLDETSHIVPNWKIDTPDPMVTIGHRCEPFSVEMIIRGYLTGSSWREYQKGAREICGVPIPDGMKEHQAFPKPIITPTTKAEQGAHDENISREEIIAQGLVTEEDYLKLEEYTYKLFEHGTKVARERGLILVDTKYEFGKKNGQIYLIDEVHTPDSSRYFYLEGYKERLDKGENQRQLSKEFVREWLMANGFMGNAGQQVPEMTEEIVSNISNRYIELYEGILGSKFQKAESSNIINRIENNVLESLKRIK
jgi:phosphoribosylaminoimidazole-succinocarboxamide synthase